MHRTGRPIAAISAAALLLGACASGNNEDEQIPPIGGEEQESAAIEVEDDKPEEPEDPYAVPDEIDEEYAELVINRLLEINTEALTIALEQEPGEPLDIEAADRLSAVLAGRRLASSLEELQAFVDDPSMRDEFLPSDEISPSRVVAREVLHAEPENCMIVAGWWDLTAVALDPPPEDDMSVFSLSRVDREVTSAARNPTPWQVRQIGAMQSDGEPIPEERWDEVNFGDALDHTCEDL